MLPNEIHAPIGSPFGSVPWSRSRWLLLPIAVASGTIALEGAIATRDLWRPFLQLSNANQVQAFLLQIALPSVLLGFSLLSWLVPRALPSIGPQSARAGRAGRWAMRLIGLPLLWFPATFLGALAKAFTVILSFGMVSPPPGRPVPYLGLPMAVAAVATVAALYGWFAPQATFRGWMRAVAFATAGAILSSLAYTASRASDLWPAFVPLSLSCLVALVATRSPRRVGEHATA